MRFTRQRIAGLGLAGLALVLIVILALVKVQSDREGAFLCKLVSETPGMTMDECPAHEDKTSWILLVAFGIAFVLLAGGIVLYFLPAILPAESHAHPTGHAAHSPSGAPAEPRAPPDLSRLDEDERKVHDLLAAREGSMYQSDLIRETGFTKVRMTRILDKLEANKLLERKRRGMTNIVILK